MGAHHASLGDPEAGGAGIVTTLVELEARTAAVLPPAQAVFPLRNEVLVRVVVEHFFVVPIPITLKNFLLVVLKFEF